MIEKIKERFEMFVDGPKDTPVIAGLISGLYPFLFYYSNNYPRINSWKHFFALFLFFVATPFVITLLAYYIFNRVEKLRTYKKHLIFVLLIFLTALFTSVAIYLTLKKKILLGILVIVILLSLKLYDHYKKIIVIMAIMALLPLFKCIIHISEDIRPSYWTKPTDDIMNVVFRQKPNVYMIQPDGYVSREVLEQLPYNYKTDFYDWLSNNDFKVYKNFRSNYPASLTSNASMFAMKHHYFDDIMFPAIEMPNARETIMNNNVVSIFKNNGYDTFYIGQDEYFQQNLVKGNYDHYNIDVKDIPLFKVGFQQDVYKDLEQGILNKGSKPQFFFVERVLPHHIHFYDKDKRKEYLSNLEKANIWLKEAIGLINKNDKNALIIILADHGGWVGMESMEEFMSTSDKALIFSTFGDLAAIHWNGINHKGYDDKLHSNVNVFRVLFSCLSENKSYLNHLEEDASYNIRPGNFITQSVHKLIDGNGTIVNEKH